MLSIDDKATDAGLGVPTGPLETPSTGIQRRPFAGVMVYATVRGTFIVTLAHHSRLVSAGDVSGSLGRPVCDTVSLPGRPTTTRFEGGVIVGTTPPLIVLQPMYEI